MSGHSYHFRETPELLAGISEENLLVQLEIEYHGGITSCNKVENYLQYSECEYDDSGNSEVSSQVHSEQVTQNETKNLNPDKSIFQVTAPLKKKAGKGHSGINHSLSEPDLARLLLRGEDGPGRSPRMGESPRRRRAAVLPWIKYVGVNMAGG